MYFYPFDISHTGPLMNRCQSRDASCVTGLVVVVVKVLLTHFSNT